MYSIWTLIFLVFQTLDFFPLERFLWLQPVWQEWCWLMLFLSMRELDPVCSQTLAWLALPSGLTVRAAFSQPSWLHSFTFSVLVFFEVLCWFSGWKQDIWSASLHRWLILSLFFFVPITVKYYEFKKTDKKINLRYTRKKLQIIHFFSWQYIQSLKNMAD